jgi:hypothetical protein
VGEGDASSHGGAVNRLTLHQETERFVNLGQEPTLMQRLHLLPQEFFHAGDFQVQLDPLDPISHRHH